MTKPDILVVTNYYLPGYKGGGPIRTIANLVRNLGHEFRFRILTTDRDWRDLEPYTGIELDRWLERPECLVYYLSSKSQELSSLRRLLLDDPSGVLHLNGLFSQLTIKILLLRYLGLLPNRKVIIAPHGVLALGSLRLKWWKKRPYVWLTNILGFYREVVWSASSECEAEDIHREFPASVMYTPSLVSKRQVEMIYLASDIMSHDATDKEIMPRPAKKVGVARFVFLSRITKVKNLEGAIDNPVENSVDCFSGHIRTSRR